MAAISAASGCSTSDPRTADLEELLLPEPRIGDYEARMLDPDATTVFLGRAYWWPGYPRADMLALGPFHGCSRSFRTGRYAHTALKGPCFVEVARHGENCASRRLGLLEHDLQLSFGAWEGALRVGTADGQRVAIRVWPDPKSATVKVGWLSDNGISVAIKFEHDVRPDALASPLVHAYLRRYPSVLREEFSEFNSAEARRRELDKVMEWKGAGAVFASLSYYPIFKHPAFLALTKQEEEEMRRWWRRNRERCPEDWRLELTDAAVEQMNEIEGERMAESYVRDKLKDALPSIAIFAFMTEPILADGLIGRYAFWKKWWVENKNRRYSEQWTALFDAYIETTADVEDGQEGDKAFNDHRKLMRLAELAQRAGPKGQIAGPPGFEDDRTGSVAGRRAVFRAWKQWWATNKGKYVPDGVREAEHRFAAECSCGRHK